MLKLNSEKTEVMLVASKNGIIKLLDKVSVNIQNINITSISEIKSFGLILGSNDVNGKISQISNKVIIPYVV